MTNDSVRQSSKFGLGFGLSAAEALQPHVVTYELSDGTHRPVPRTSQYRYLGFLLCDTLNEDKHMNITVATVRSRVDRWLSARVTLSLPPMLALQIIKTYVLSAALYLLPILSAPSNLLTQLNRIISGTVSTLLQCNTIHVPKVALEAEGGMMSALAMEIRAKVRFAIQTLLHPFPRNAATCILRHQELQLSSNWLLPTFPLRFIHDGARGPSTTVRRKYLNEVYSRPSSTWAERFLAHSAYHWVVHLLDVFRNPIADEFQEILAMTRPPSVLPVTEVPKRSLMLGLLLVLVDTPGKRPFSTSYTSDDWFPPGEPLDIPEGHRHPIVTRLYAYTTASRVAAMVGRFFGAVEWIHKRDQLRKTHSRIGTSNWLVDTLYCHTDLSRVLTTAHNRSPLNAPGPYGGDLLTFLDRHVSNDFLRIRILMAARQSTFFNKDPIWRSENRVTPAECHLCSLPVTGANHILHECQAPVLVNQRMALWPVLARALAEFLTDVDMARWGDTRQPVRQVTHGTFLSLIDNTDWTLERPRRILDSLLLGRPPSFPPADNDPDNIRIVLETFSRPVAPHYIRRSFRRWFLIATDYIASLLGTWIGGGSGNHQMPPGPTPELSVRFHHHARSSLRMLQARGKIQFQVYKESDLDPITEVNGHRVTEAGGIEFDVTYAPKYAPDEETLLHGEDEWVDISRLIIRTNKHKTPLVNMYLAQYLSARNLRIPELPEDLNAKYVLQGAGDLPPSPANTSPCSTP